MIKFIKRLFHTHTYTRIQGSEKLLGYFHGLGIYNVKLRCECGKEKDIQTEDLLF